MRRLWGFLLFLVFISSVNAAIFIDDDFDRKYNVGDKVVLEFSVMNDGIVEDFVESYLKCDGDNVLIDKRYVFLDDEKKNFSLEFPLGEVGDCQFEIEYLNEEAVSDEFEISDDIEITYTLNDKYFFPEEEIVIYGSLRKFNGDKFNGVIDFEIEGVTEKSFEVKSGEFNFTYEILENEMPGEYDLILNIEEKDVYGNILNSGKIEEKIYIRSTPTSLFAEVLETLKPAKNVTFSVDVLDQAGDFMSNETVLVKIFDSQNNLKFQEEFLSGEEFNYYFNSDFPRGSAYFNAYYGSIVLSKPIYIEDNRKIKTELVGNTLKFINTGNILYDGIVGFSLDDGENKTEEFVNVSVSVGDVYLYQLKYNGVYNITSDDNVFRGAHLTGAVILDDEGDIKWTSLIVLIVFVCILAYGYFLTRKKTKEDRKKRKKSKKTKKTQIDINGNKIEHKVSDVKVRKEKLVLKENENKREESLKKKVFMMFVRSEGDVSEYESIVSNYGYRFNKVERNLGYVIFYQSSEISPGYKIFNLSRALLKFGEGREDKLSIVLNRGIFEKKVSILKKFALFNKSILDMFPGKLVVSDKIMNGIHVKVDKIEKIIEVMDRKIKVWII